MRKIKGIKGKFVYEENLFLFNNEINIVLQPIKKIHVCNMIMYEFYQGIHVNYYTNKELECLGEIVEQKFKDILILAMWTLYRW